MLFVQQQQTEWISSSLTANSFLPVLLCIFLAMGHLIIAHYYHQVHKMNIDETDGVLPGDGERMGGHISVSMVSPKLFIINC